MKFLLLILFFPFFNVNSQVFKVFDDNILKNQQEEKIKTLKVKRITTEFNNTNAFTSNKKPYFRRIKLYDENSKIVRQESQGYKSSYITTYKYNNKGDLINNYFSRRKGNFGIAAPTAKLLGAKIPNSIAPDRKEYTYDDNDKLLEEKSCEVSKCEIKTYRYTDNRIFCETKDINGNLKKINIEQKNSDKEIFTTINELGEATERTVFIYDANRNLIEIKDYSEGRLRQHQNNIIDQNNRCTKTIIRRHSIFSKTNETYLNESTVTYFYNSRGLLEKKVKNSKRIEITKNMRFMPETEKHYYYANGLVKRVESYMDNNLRGITTYKYKMH